MAEKNTVLEIIYTALDTLNPELPEEQRLEKSEDTPLYGKGSTLDSLGLVGFIVALETRLQDELGATVSITGTRALARKDSPFRTLGTLADYVAALLNEDGAE